MAKTNCFEIIFKVSDLNIVPLMARFIRIRSFTMIFFKVVSGIMLDLGSNKLNGRGIYPFNPFKEGCKFTHP